MSWGQPWRIRLQSFPVRRPELIGEPDEINAGCWLLQFHGTPQSHPACLPADWDICKLSSLINSCLWWQCLRGPRSGFKKVFAYASLSPLSSLLEFSQHCDKEVPVEGQPHCPQELIPFYLFLNTLIRPVAQCIRTCTLLMVISYLTCCNHWTPLGMANPSSLSLRWNGLCHSSPDEIKICHVCCGHRSRTCPDGPSESFLAATYSVYIPISITDTSQVLISLFITKCPADLESIPV